jgi:CubicO group peptidase (beta-lactamase class C family)
MLRPLLSLLLLLPLAALAQSPGPLAPTLQPFVDSHVAGGLVVLVADKDRVLDLEALGLRSLRDNAPMQTDDLFWIASMSKSLTSTAFMMLVDEGKVNINDPVEKYLPEFKGQMVVDEHDKTNTPRPPTHPILIREILSHTSGMIQEKELTREQFQAHDELDLKKVVQDYAARPLKRQPGTGYEYNNAGINTAGRIIEVVSGMPYAEFMQTRLFTPLGMKDTTFWPTQEQAARLAHSFKFTPDKKNLVEFDDYYGNKAGIDSLEKRTLGSAGVVPAPILSDMGFGNIFTWQKHYAMPAGGLYSTATDLSRFCRMLLNGGVFEGKRYLTQDAIKQLTTSQTEHTTPNPHYALGWEIKPDAAGVPGAGTFAHTGARRTRMWVDPTNGLVMILLMERMDLPPKDEQRLYPAFLTAAIQKFARPAAR